MTLTSECAGFLPTGLLERRSTIVKFKGEGRTHGPRLPKRLRQELEDGRGQLQGTVYQVVVRWSR